MDDTGGMAKLDRSRPIVVGANWYRFRSGEQIRYGHIASVSFIWVVRGSGTIVSAGRQFPMTSRSILMLPWMHDIDYQPDERSPFQVGTVHIVPKHDAHVPVQSRVAFLAGDPLLDSPHRHSDGHPSRPILASHRSASARRVSSLAAYGVDRFTESFDLATFAALGELILGEARSWEMMGEAELRPPQAVHVMADYVRYHLNSHLTVAEVAKAGSCSVATAERLFTQHLGLSVLAWIRDQRMLAAADLLRSSGMRVSEVAREVGYPDPLYFSRVFHATHGVAPSRYARDILRP